MRVCKLSDSSKELSPKAKFRYEATLNCDVDERREDKRSSRVPMAAEDAVGVGGGM